jgi:hypothetical protein
LIDRATAHAAGANFQIARTTDGIVLRFPVLRAPAPALGLLAFAALCGLLPALGLSALLPLQADNAAAMVSLALIGGFAAPFVLAGATFALLAVYSLANSLRVDITPRGVQSERRVFGCVTRRGQIARENIASIEPQISARYQNLFSTTPRYALIAKHVAGRDGDVVIAEDVPGHLLMIELRTLACGTLAMTITQ